MVIKIDRGDGTFHLFPEVKDVITSGPMEYAKCLQYETLPEYFERLMGPSSASGVGSEPGRPSTVSWYGISPDDYPKDRRELFFGRRYEVEKFCMKKLCFVQNNIEYNVVTEFPVYLCQDNGKTIEVIK